LLESEVLASSQAKEVLDGSPAKKFRVDFPRITTRHSRESGNPGRKHVDKERFTTWIPAFAGMTVPLSTHRCSEKSSEKLMNT